jgi:hypothetical protein
MVFLLREVLGFKVSGFSVQVSGTTFPGLHMRLRVVEQRTAEPGNSES